MKRTALFAAGLLAAIALPAHAQSAVPVDSHAVFEKNCYACHTEHAADFARLRLQIKAGKLVISASGKDVAPLLKSHRGVKLKPDEITALTQLFRNGLTWGGIYQRKCASCHDKAVSFARSTLKTDGAGNLIGKDGRDVAAFLPSHGGPSVGEAAVLIEMLKYQLATAPKP